MSQIINYFITYSEKGEVMTKESVLAILKQNNDYVSGEKISNELGVSRMAISTAVKALRKDGYDIVSVTNRGYLLKHNPNLNRLTSGELMSYLSKERMKNVLCLDTIDSTNTKLRQLAFDNAPAGYVVIANEQTGGRGRLGRSFHSPKDNGIYISMLLRPDCMPKECTTITAWTAVAISSAIEKVAGINVDIKWVNDLFLNQKKIAGILTELSVESESGHVQHIIVGIGINVNEKAESFPDELKDIASSIYAQTGKYINRAELAAAIITELDTMISRWPDYKEYYLDEYRKRNITTGRDIYVISGDTKTAAYAIGINEDFSLRVRYSDGKEENLSSGEVSTRFS